MPFFFFDAQIVLKKQGLGKISPAKTESEIPAPATNYISPRNCRSL